MKKIWFIPSLLAMLVMSACSQQENVTVADSLTPEEQEKYDQFIAFAKEAGWDINENPTLEEQRKLIQTDFKTFEDLLNCLNGDGENPSD